MTKIIFGILMFLSMIAQTVYADEEMNRKLYYQPAPQAYATQLPESTDIQDRAVAMFLDHGITGLVLLILGWWYYQRQKRWDEESAEMRKELIEYVKADQTSDYDMMNRIDTSKQELKEVIYQMKDEILRELVRK